MLTMTVEKAKAPSADSDTYSRKRERERERGRERGAQGDMTNLPFSLRPRFYCFTYFYLSRFPVYNN